MKKNPRVLVDTSVLFSAVWSVDGGSRLLLKLGEAGAIQLLVSPQVLNEVEYVIRRKGPDLLPLVSLLLDKSRAELVESAGKKEVNRLQKSAGYPGDAQIAADAVSAHADFLVSLDKLHLLGNSELQKLVPCRIVSPGEFIAWFRDQLKKL